MSTSLSRRSFTAGSIATLVAGAGSGAAAGAASVPGRRVTAQEAMDVASLGLPEMDITVLADGFAGAPTGIEAGRYLLNVSREDNLESGGAEFILPPEELTAEQFLLDLNEPTGLQAEPGDDEGESPLGEAVQPVGYPLVAYEATFAGGIIVAAGISGPAQAVIDLTPGDWVLWGGRPEAPQVPLIFTVTGEMPGDLPEPSADVDVVLDEDVITFDGELTAGDHILRIQHQGEEPHHLEIRKGPDSMTGAHIEQVIQAEAGDEAAAENLPFDPEEDLQTVLATGDLSGGATMWAPVTLETGSYVALCLVPFRENAAPHALQGQYTLFQVE